MRQFLTRLTEVGLAVAAWCATNSSLVAQVPGYTITTVSGEANKVALIAHGIAIDTAGNLYISEDSLLNLGAGAILKVSPDGTSSIVAGGGTLSGSFADGGSATSANLATPAGIALDAGGNLYIAEAGANRIRKVSATGTISTVAGPGSTNGALGDGGPAIGATLVRPAGLALDSVGNIYVADTGHNRIRKIALDGTITTVAGNGSSTTALGDGGQATGATLSTPTGVAFDSVGNLYVADCGHSRIRRVSATGTISTVAGNGTSAYSGDGGLATLASIAGDLDAIPLPLLSIGVDGAGNLYVVDTGNARVRLVTSDGKINTIAGSGASHESGDNGLATNAGLGIPVGVALGSGGRIYVLDELSGGTIRLLTPSATPIFPPPSIETRGVFSASAFGPFTQTALGSWVEIYGSYLANNSRSWSSADFQGVDAPISLDGTSVTIGGQPAFISYISPGQINAQVPTSVGTGAQPLIVTTAAGKSAAYSVIVNGVEPGLLAPPSFTIGSTSYVVALFPDNATFVLPSGAIAGQPSRPAKAGDTITLYGVGFGAVAPTIQAGRIVQTNNALAFPFRLNIGPTEATVTYAGLAPNLVGLYQFNVTVPKLNATGAVRLSFTLGGVAGTQNLALAVQ
jgi:uncharacterized protein (TIGR03437 family)